jgi:3-methyl-2-oxobutanoate hydroxymethyltransferase
LKDAKALEQVGVFSIVLEGVKSDVAKKITSNIKIPTIGIGASNYCDGQVLVTDDLLGLTNSNIKFVKKYTDLGKSIQTAVKSFRKEVINKKFPSKKYSY